MNIYLVIEWELVDDLKQVRPLHAYRSETKALEEAEKLNESADYPHNGYMVQEISLLDAED